MESLVHPPIFVPADGALFVFSSVEGSQTYVRWPDVEGGVYHGYDSEGRLIEFRVKTFRVKRRFSLGTRLERDVLLTIEPEPMHARELRSELLCALGRTIPEEVARASLSELKKLAVARFGFIQ